MPVVTLQIQSGWTPQEKKKLLTTLQLAIAESLRVPKNDVQMRINEYPAENLLLAPDKSAKYIVIEIALFLGRSIAIKKNLYQEINACLNAMGIAENDIFIVLHEIPRENFGIRGGVPASEINFDYKINI